MEKFDVTIVTVKTQPIELVIRFDKDPNENVEKVINIFTKGGAKAILMLDN